jgi:hypothetical protein
MNIKILFLTSVMLITSSCSSESADANFDGFMYELINTDFGTIDESDKKFELVDSFLVRLSDFKPDYKSFGGTYVTHTYKLLNQAEALMQAYPERLNLEGSIKKELKDRVLNERYAYELFQECRETFGLKKNESLTR